VTVVVSPARQHHAACTLCGAFSLVADAAGSQIQVLVAMPPFECSTRRAWRCVEGSTTSTTSTSKHLWLLSGPSLLKVTGVMTRITCEGIADLEKRPTFESKSMSKSSAMSLIPSQAGGGASFAFIRVGDDYPRSELLLLHLTSEAGHGGDIGLLMVVNQL
jgi:hypothetical protein